MHSSMPKKAGAVRGTHNMRPVLKNSLICHKKACLLTVALVLFQPKLLWNKAAREEKRARPLQL